MPAALVTEDIQCQEHQDAYRNVRAFLTAFNGQCPRFRVPARWVNSCDSHRITRSRFAKCGQIFNLLHDLSAKRSRYFRIDAAMSDVNNTKA